VRCAATIAIVLGGVTSNFATIDWYITDTADMADNLSALPAPVEEHDAVVRQSRRRVPQESLSALVTEADKAEHPTPVLMILSFNFHKHTRERAPPTQG